MRDAIAHLAGADHAYGLDRHVGSPSQTDSAANSQAPLPSTGEAVSRTRGLREKLIGVRSPGMPSGEMRRPRALICGSSSASATVLIGPAGTPARSRAAISAPFVWVTVCCAMIPQSAVRLETRAGFVA